MATENVTTKFKIDISEFKAGITEANKQIKLANAEFNAATAGMDDWSKSTDGISAKLKQLNSTLEAQKSKLAAYRGQLEAQEKAYAENGKRAEELKAKLKELADNGVSKTSDEYKQYKKSLTEVEKEMASNRTAADNLRVTILNQEAAVGQAERDIRNYNRQLDALQNGAGKTEKASVDLSKSVDKVSASADDAERSSDDLTRSVDKAADSADTAEKKFGNLASKIAAGLAAAATAAGGFFVAAVQTGMSFDKAMSQVAATLGTTTDQISELREFAQEMGATTAFSATQAADALNYMALAGYDADKSMKMLPSVLNLAAAGGMELATASDMVTDAQSALGLSIEQTAEMVDKIAKASSKSNTSVAQLGEAILEVGGTAKNLAGGTTELATSLGILADNGMKGAEGGTKLRNIISSLTAPTDKAAGLMEELGISAFDANGNVLPLNETFAQLDDILDGMTQQERINVISEIFNARDIKAAEALLANYGKRWKELSGYIDDAAGSAAEMAETQLDNLSGNVILAKSAFEGLQIAISEKATPALNEFVKFGANALSEMTRSFRVKGLEGLVDSLSDQLDKGIEMLFKRVPIFVDAGAKILGSLSKGIVNNLPTLINGVTRIITTIISDINGSMPDIVKKGTEILLSLVFGIIQSLPAITDAAVTTVERFAEEVTQPERVGEMVGAGIRLVEAMISGIINAVPRLIDAAIGAAGNLLESLTGLKGFSDFIKEQKEVIEAAIAALIAYKAATAIAGAVSAAVTAVKTLTSAFAGMNAVAAMNPIGAIAAAAAGAFVLIDNAMKNSSRSVMDAADEMSQSIQGIASATQEVVDKQADLESIGAKYEYINTQITDDEEKKRQLKELQEQLNSLYGEEARNIDLVNGKYSEQIGLLEEMTDRELGVTTRKVEKSLEEANKAVSEVIKKMSGESIDYIAALGEDAVNGPMEELARKYSRQMDEATGKMKGFLDLSAQGFTFNFTGEEDLEEVIQFYTELLDVMEQTGEGGEGVADTLLPLFDDIFEYSKELEAAGANIDGLREKLAALQKQAEKTTFKSTAPSVRQGLPSYVVDMQNGVKSAGEAAADVMTEATEEGEKSVAAASETVKKTLTFATKAIGEYKNLGVVKQLGKALSEEQEEADKIAAAVWNKSQEVFNRSIKNNQLSVAEQVKGWETIRNQFVEGSDQWIAANDKVIESQQKLEEENKKSAETMAKDTKAAFESMQDDIAKLQAETDKSVAAMEQEITDLQAAYDKAVSDRASQIANQYGLFDDVPERAEKSGTDLLRALTAQVDDIEQFYKNIEKLSDRGVSEELVESIRAMGVKASGELDALLGMTDDQLAKYDAKFAEKRELSTQIAEKELEPLKAETEGRIEEIKQEITDLQTETEQQINDIKLSYISQVATAGTDFASAFISSMSGGIQAGAKELVTGVKNAVTDAWTQAFNGQELSSLLSLTSDTSGKSAIISAIQKALDGVLKTLNEILNRIRSVEISGFKPFEGLWDKNPLTLPKLARGGVLKRGEVGLLEGSGAEAVVPLENNAAWIGAVADDMRREMKTVNVGGGVTTNDNRTTFTQNIYAPTAPSRFELYRQTKNLLALMKEGVVNV